MLPLALACLTAIGPPQDAARTSPLLARSEANARGAVLLNVTAAWCVTCKVNEQVALSGSDFLAALAEHLFGERPLRIGGILPPPNNG